MAIDNVLASIDRDLDASLARLFDLLKIRSISTDPAYRDECARAAAWLASELKGIGFDASVRATTGNPMVVAHARSANANAPHVLFYGHYDVQPVDPLELWEDDPFAPKIVEAEGSKRIVARGAADDKGQLMAFVEACRAFMGNGGLPAMSRSSSRARKNAARFHCPPFWKPTGRSYSPIACSCATRTCGTRTRLPLRPCCAALCCRKS